MSLDRKIWSQDFSQHSALPWRCPSCAGAKLRIQKGTLKEGETADSRESHSELAFEPEWIQGRFACLLECPNCTGEIGLTGTYQVRDERGYMDGQEVGDYCNYYTPLYFTEAPHIIDVPENAPEEVSAEIMASFQLFWADPLACANRIRSAIDALLTAQRVNRSTGGPRTGKPRKMLGLHRRIELFGDKRAALADKLMAIKWIGNAGSHSDAVTTRDLLDAYDILCFVLDELYVRRAKRIGALARRINRRAAPLSHQRTAKR